jgi:DNA-binding protein HU-beta
MARPLQLIFRRDMTKTEFIDTIGSGYDTLPRTEFAHVIETALDRVGREMKPGGSVQITGFSTFSTVKRKARRGRNPETGEPIKISAMMLPKFSAGTTLKALVATKNKSALVRLSTPVRDGVPKLFDPKRRG